MRFRLILLIIMTVVALTCSIASCENAATDFISYDEWDWDNESVNTFTGSIDLSRWSGLELTLEMKAAFEPESTSAYDTVPKFTHFNGRRLTMLEQRDNITCIPSADQETVSFTGSVQMPEKDHFKKISIDLAVVDAEDKELKKISVSVTRDGAGSTQKGSIFYIPFEIRTAAIIIGAAAVLVWFIAISRNRILNRNK